MVAPVIVWFRQDLRLEDNPAFTAAVNSGAPVLAVYIDDAQSWGKWCAGGATRWWLHHALVDLREQLEGKGLRLHCFQGDCVKVLEGLVEEFGATQLFFGELYEPFARAQETQVRKALASRLKVEGCEGFTLYAPTEVRNQQGKPYKVFTPFWKAIRPREVSRPLALGKQSLVAAPEPSGAVTVEALGLLPKIAWDGGLKEAWVPTRAGGLSMAREFLKARVDAYSSARDIPSVNGTSRLSPYLHFGQISPRELWHLCLGLSGGAKTVEVYLRQLAWRDFAIHLLYHFPETTDAPLQPAFEHFPWEENAEVLGRWQRGQTGYPIVDAGMRQLWKTGWMHNRVRMIVASFLVKDLRVSWLRGAEWFWDTLVDADLANNTFGWQWAGGCGADAAPYFRVFNPMLQGAKFDGAGKFVREYCPELARLPDKYLHAPWEAPAEVLREAGVRLGEDYPEPMVDHAQARQRALNAYEKLKALRNS